MTTLRPLFLAALLAAGPACDVAVDVAAPADPATLKLVAADSTIWFVGIKNNAVPVPGSFTGLRGEIDVAGRTGFVEVSVASLETGDEERDSNIRIHLFGESEHPMARFDIRGADGAPELPAIGSSVELDITGVLTLRGLETPLAVPARLTGLGPGRVRVRTRAPLVLTKDALQLGAPFNVLQAVCGHEALAGAVPVELDLVFDSS